MKIQINTDNNLSVSQEFNAKLTELLTSKLARYNNYITTLEVHLTDTNGHKEGVNDRRCVIEARLKGLKPIAVTETANIHDSAVAGAIVKLKAALDTTLGKLKSH